MKRVILVGNPNCGKTTLFNALTGANQRVGNWPGVTVEKKTGVVCSVKNSLEVTDLPGIYSLNLADNATQDDQIAIDAIHTLPYDLIINVIDACALERHLYLTSQLIELRKPTLVVLNMTDIAKQRGIAIDINALSKTLRCPVIAIQAHKKIGLENLLEQLTAPSPQSPNDCTITFPENVQALLNHVKNEWLKAELPQPLASYYANRLLEGDETLLRENVVSTATCTALKKHIKSLKATFSEDIEVLMADARYHNIHQWVQDVQRKRSDMSEYFTAKLDRIVLHRYFALPLFFGVMYLMFFFAVNLGGAFQDFFDMSTEAIFVQGSAWCLQQLNAPLWLIALVASGIGKGINTTLTFVPVLASMYFFLALLEASGYMARAAFVVDKGMRFLGLPGQSFVPMIVGFGCNVPAVLAARTLESGRDRWLTILMSPFMSCSARLAIYAVFVAAFFPHGGQNIIFSLYLMGIAMAMLTGFILRRTLLKGQASPLILELPPYHRPTFKRLLRETRFRLQHFLNRASKMIIPVCMLLGLLEQVTFSQPVSAGFQTISLLGVVGQWLTPLVTPFGVTADNWPATVGLLTGFLAKEVVIGTLNSLYTQTLVMWDSAVSLSAIGVTLKEAVLSIPENLGHFLNLFIHPTQVSVGDDALAQPIYGIMAERFDGKAGAYAYLIFILLYVPCVSTMAVIRQETNTKLMWFSIIWSAIIAYASAVLFYQIATFIQHPSTSLAWVISILSSLCLGYYGLKRYCVKAEKRGETFVIADSGLSTSRADGK
ncbi:MAG: Fe(2+) transporter permease subunit FeoB [Legionella sp.]|nr:Fe(2+) transporter permease subunit FeoB [Legionella sp.]